MTATEVAILLALGYAFMFWLYIIVKQHGNGDAG